MRWIGWIEAGPTGRATSSSDLDARGRSPGIGGSVGITVSGVGTGAGGACVVSGVGTAVAGAGAAGVGASCVESGRAEVEAVLGGVVDGVPV
ncbi:MAG TPA: hypothetical protein VNW46_02610, partial [Gemmatimonadaceae bacterium]|nr:hypothetical protein [Gemmatimonadaceae bacterium]